MYVADYVLMEYGTGAIMAVPGHDERDYDFAHDLRPADPPRDRAAPDGDDGRAAATPATACSSTPTPHFDGLGNREALAAIVAWLDREGKGHASVNYRLRDWLVSRQRYWGCPIPIVYCETLRDRAGARGGAAGRAARHRGLHAQGPLAAGGGRGLGARPAARSCGGPARRETDTMDTFVDSSWYFLRYCDARNDDERLGPGGAARVDAGRPVHRRRRARDPAPDVRALLHKALADLGHLDFQEPFQALFTQGMVTKDGAKMSKSRGNVVSPASIVERAGRRHGALLHPVRRPARPGRRLVRRGRRGRAPLPRAAVAARRRRRPSAARGEPGARLRRTRAKATIWRCCARRTGRSTRSAATCAASPSTPRSRR